MGEDSPSSFSDLTVRDKVRAVMLARINDSTGVKVTQLMTDVTAALVDDESPDFIVGDKSLKENCELHTALHEILDDLIRTGEIVELEFTLAASDYRARTILFPKGTHFNF